MKKLLCALGLMPFMAVASTWYVDGTNGSDTNDGLSEATAKATIQAAVDSVSDGDCICVASGTYAPFVITNLNVAIESKTGFAETIIDGHGDTSVGVVVYSRTTSVRGFTIQHTGRIYGPTISQCIIRENDSRSQGGGALNEAIAENCLILNNVGLNGAASDACILRNCTIIGNSASGGYNGVCLNSVLENCIVYGNANDERQTWQTWFEKSWLANADHREACVYVGDPGFVDAANGDYHLTKSSPCVNAGTNLYVNCAEDLDGNKRIVAQTVDVGCYELQAWCDDSLTAEATPADGTKFCFSTNVVLTAKEGEEIHYTMDGSEPTKDSTVYSSALSISATMTIKYFVVDPVSENWGPVASATYTRVPGEKTTIVVTPSVETGTRFIGEQAVELKAGEGDTIWYTTDESDPKTSETRVQYKDPIQMTESGTIKYYAVNADGDYGPVAEAYYIKRLADGGPYTEVVDGITWTFTIVEGYSAIVSATENNARVAGSVLIPSELGGCIVTTIGESAFERDVELNEVTIPSCITSIGYWAFRDCRRLAKVTFEGARPHLDLGAFEATPALDVISPRKGVLTAIIPTDIEADVVSIPETWFDQLATQHKGNVPAGYATYEEAFNAKFGSDHTKALVKETGKFDASGHAMQVWQDYVAGTDPLDEEDVFTATLTMEDGVPVVRWSPELTATQAALRTYKVYGSKSLSIDWVDVSELTDAERQVEGYQFFKVSVQMK